MGEPKQKFSEFRMPQEEMLEVSRQKSNLTIGVPKETILDENRVALVPDGIALLVSHGHRVLIEAGAGVAAHFPDHEYSESGGHIVYSPEDVFKSDIILKVSPASSAESSLLKPKQVLISALQMGIQKEEYFRELMNRKIIALAFELIRDKSNSFPVIRAMSEIAGGT